MIPILICLFLGVFAFILSVKLHDGFSRMVLHNIGMVETQKNAMWYALVTPEKREYLRPKMERHNWTNGEPKNSEYKYLHGYLALNMGDIRLLCPKNAAWQRNLAEQCLQLTKADLVPFGASTSPLYIPRCLAAQLKPANTLIKTSYILPALAGNPSCKIPLRYSQ